MLNVECVLASFRSTFNIEHSTFPVSLPKPHLINPPPLRPVLRLVIRPRRIVRSGNACFGSEKLRDQRRGALEVLAMVGDVDAAAASHERPPHLRQHLDADDAALLFALARSGVGKVDVDLAESGVYVTDHREY